MSSLHHPGNGGDAVSQAGEVAYVKSKVCATREHVTSSEAFASDKFDRLQF